MSLIKIPIELVNKIMVYVCELNNGMIITQFCPNTHKEYYQINFNSNLVWRIHATLILKRTDPIYDSEYFCNSYNRRLYQSGIEHYEKVVQ